MDSPSTGKEAEIDATIKAYEEEWQRSKRFVLGLRKQRNALQPACRLPNELLGEVFRHAVQMSTGFNIISPKWPRLWLTITHVCELWRRVAIDHHALWTSIQFAKSPQLVKMFAERAGNCTLKILGDNHRGAWAQFIPPFIASHASHIASLDGLLLTYHRCTAISDLLAPEPCYEALERLHFSVSDSSDQVSLVFPPKALPRLSHLWCSGVTQSFIEALPALKLTTLHITRPTRKLKAGTWIGILQGLGALESLGLHDTFEVVSSRANLPFIDNSALAHLPHLKTLSLEEPDAGYTLLQVLEHLVFPATVKVVIGVDDFLEPEDFAHLMLSLAAVASGKAPSKITMSPFVSCIIESDGVRLWTHEMPVAERSSQTVYRVARRESAPDWTVNTSGVAQDLLPSIFNALSFFPLRSLAIDVYLYTPFGLFSELASFPTIRELFVNRRAAVEALVNVHEAMWANPESSTLLPNLELLALGNVSWMEHSKPSLQSLEAPNRLALRLETMLQTRNTFVEPIKRLKILGSKALAGWDPMSLAEKNVAGKVEVDEKGWGVDYICECDECQAYTAATNMEDEDEETD